MGPSRAEGSTTAGIDTSVHRRTVVLRDVVTGLLALVLLAGLAGLLGDRSTTVQATDGERSLRVTYAPVGRTGTGIPWRVTLHDPAGLPPEVELAVDARYLAIFEHQRFYPEPSEETRDGDELLLTFTTQGQQTLVVEHDAYLAPRWSPPRAGRVSLVEDATRPLTVTFRTLLVP